MEDPSEHNIATKMNWPFCPTCGATVIADAEGSVRCPCCPFITHLSNIPASKLSLCTVSNDTMIPIWAKSDEEQMVLERAAQEGISRATVEEPCVKCGAPEVKFYTMQLRSVDEGQTVFYECPQCKHTWSVNN